VYVFKITELYGYASSVRRRFAQKLAELPWAEVDKNREASFYSMKNILLHMVDNEDWIVNWVIQGRAADYKRSKKSADYTNMESVLYHLDDVERKTKLYLETSNEEELGRRIRFTFSNGDSFDSSVEECLFQSFTEQLYHLGELIALLWQINVEPPRMQWFYNNPRANSDGAETRVTG
jgi:uncharacterized damage-inducible protein DinB